MLYIFVINSREDYRSKIRAEVERQLSDCLVEHLIYETAGQGDAIRFVRLYCDLHDKEQACFVACGGAGTLCEVASALVGHKGKSLAFLAFGKINEFCKSWPSRDFHSLRKIVDGEHRPLDIIRVGDNYALNSVSIGFGIRKADRTSTLRDLLPKSSSKIAVSIDGEALPFKSFPLAIFANGEWCGGHFHNSPEAVMDDGLMDVSIFKRTTMVQFFHVLRKCSIGAHLEDKFCRKRMVCRKARRVELSSRDLIYVVLDGEVVASTNFSVEVLPSEIDFVMPGL